MRLHFGKFNGQQIDEVPLWYLDWLANQPWLAQRFPLLATAARQRLDGDDNQTSTAINGDVLKTWRRTVLAKWHPDKDGGSHSAFLAVSDAVETLSAMLTHGGRA